MERIIITITVGDRQPVVIDLGAEPDVRLSTPDLRGRKQREIIRLLYDTPGLTAKQIATAGKMDISNCSAALRTMERKGIVRIVDPNMPMKWALVQALQKEEDDG